MDPNKFLDPNKIMDPNNFFDITDNFNFDTEKQNFIDIWTSEKSNKARKKLFNSKRDFSPCNVCDAKGDLIGNIHSEAWKEIL